MIDDLIVGNQLAIYPGGIIFKPDNQVRSIDTQSMVDHVETDSIDTGRALHPQSV